MRWRARCTFGSATGTALTAGPVAPGGPNEFSFVGFAVGTAAQTITVTAPYTNDSGQLNPTTPAGLFSFVSASSYLPTITSSTATATITSEPWSSAIATFRTISLPIYGNVNANTEGVKASYRAASSFAPTGTAATDVFVIGGSATKVIKVTHLAIACTATAAIATDVIILKRSTADTVGTPVAATLVPLDSNDAAATATVNAYTANPTTGSLVGNLSLDKASITATTGAPQFYFEDFGIRNTRSVVLRGTAQQVAFNLNGASITGIACDAEVEWTEE